MNKRLDINWWELNPLQFNFSPYYGGREGSCLSISERSQIHNFI